LDACGTFYKTVSFVRGKSITRGTYNTASVEVSLEPAVRPGVDRLVKGLLISARSSIGGLSILVAGVGGSSAVSGSSASRDGVAEELSAVLADEGAELIKLGALGNWRPC